MRWALLTRRDLWGLRATITAYEQHAEHHTVSLSDPRRINYGKLLEQYWGSVVIERWKRFVYKRKRSRSALQYLTAFHFFHLSRETLANISVFM